MVTPNGREILVNLSKNINSKRYFSDLSDIIEAVLIFEGRIPPYLRSQGLRR